MKKYILMLLMILVGPASSFANDIACFEASSLKPVMRFSSQNPIPDYSFEKFKIHSSYGSVSINGKDLGSQWLSVKNSGIYLEYEIKIQSASRRPIAYVHLSLDKSGIFNGYQQYDNSLSGRLIVEQLNCKFTSSLPKRFVPFGGICCSKAASNATGCDPGC